jgi:hypothetical protein
MAAWNAVRSCLQHDRIDLAVTAYQDIASMAGTDPVDEIALTEQGKCANALVNVYLDTDITRASEIARSAERALRSPEYLAALAQVGEEDPDGFLRWVDDIIHLGT